MPPNLIIITATPSIKTQCYHCGDDCYDPIYHEEKTFCCQGCKQVFTLLENNQLCNYYQLDSNPGLKAKGKFVSERFAYLEDESVIQQLTQFRSRDQINVTFSLPQMHCSSCVYLLENLHRIEPGIIRSQTHFTRKEIFIVFNPQQISLRKVVELLAFVGYEPSLSLNDAEKQKEKKTSNKSRIYQMGVAGFCFSNIMMLSFPEYFSGGAIEVDGLKAVFTWLIFGLSIPVLFYSARTFFTAAIAGFRQGIINIDAPIALATLITFSRSYYEIISGTGSGYLDSGSGIVFFMLIGRWFQDRTYDAIAFDRNYLSFFPLGVTVMRGDQEHSIPATQLKKGDRIVLRNEEMIPADALLLEGDARIDYSFVTGENTPVLVSHQELVQAGGKQLGGRIQLEIVNEASQSYITQLWNKNELGQSKNKAESFIHPWARYFTITLFAVALGGFIYWSITDPVKAFPALTSVLIVACPCTLLLSATFTNGHMLSIFGKHQLYMKNANVIETLADVDTVVFDKTGTITLKDEAKVEFVGPALEASSLQKIAALSSHSAHPLSKILFHHLQFQAHHLPAVYHFTEIAGKGMQANIDGTQVKLGAAGFIMPNQILKSQPEGTVIHVSIGGNYKGYFKVNNQYRKGLDSMVEALRLSGYQLKVLSGDHDGEAKFLSHLMGPDTEMLFQQNPQDKLDQLKKWQAQGKKILMVGDGLNDAGALLQSEVGIAVSDDASRFTPASDAIIQGNVLHKLHQLIQFARSGKTIISICFVVSILYNIIGLSIAVQAKLSPIIAAMLMPASSISVVLLTLLLSRFFAWKYKLMKK